MTREPMAEPAETEELFVAFANTLSHTRGIAHDEIPDVEALLDWLRAHDLLSSRGRATEGLACGAIRTKASDGSSASRTCAACSTTRRPPSRSMAEPSLSSSPS